MTFEIEPADKKFESHHWINLPDNLRAVGADSTAVNTGRKNGAIRLLECKLGRPLHWFICNLHLNELPLRHLCKKYIGPTESSTQWKGSHGKALQTCESLPLSPNGIQCISEGPLLPEIDPLDLSKDQAYLYKIIQAIKTGVISVDLLQEKPGPMSHARWLTTASRICRLFVATVQPSQELYAIALFVVCHYRLMWFQIKKYLYCTDGPYQLLSMVKLM